MGAGKSTLGAALSEKLARPFVDVDREIEREEPIARIFETGGEAAFRLRESKQALDALGSATPAVIALGGGAVGTDQIRRALRGRAVTVLVEIDAEEAWRRVGGGDRPLAQDEAAFRTLYEQRQPLYDGAADARTSDLEGAVLAAGGVHVEPGALEQLGELVPGDGQIEIVSDARVAGIYGMDVQLALGARARAVHELAPGEQAKTVESLEALWHALRLERSGTLVALGGGCTTDVAGFAAATYFRGVDWVAVPTTLVGQVDAAIGGKTAIDLPDGKNLVGAFHWPVRTVIDPATLETLPPEEAANGRAEVVKTGLLAGEPIWELPLGEQVRRAAAFKTALCLRDPHDRGERAQLNLGHTFAHAARSGGGLRAAARTRCRARPARRAAALRPRDRRRRGDAPAGAGAGRPRRGVGGARARQEGRGRHAAARAPRGPREAPRRCRGPARGRSCRAERPDRWIESRAMRVARLSTG